MIDTIAWNAWMCVCLGEGVAFRNVVGFGCVVGTRGHLGVNYKDTASMFLFLPTSPVQTKRPFDITHWAGQPVGWEQVLLKRVGALCLNRWAIATPFHR